MRQHIIVFNLFFEQFSVKFPHEISMTNPIKSPEPQLIFLKGPNKPPRCLISFFCLVLMIFLTRVWGRGKTRNTTYNPTRPQGKNYKNFIHLRKNIKLSLLCCFFLQPFQTCLNTLNHCFFIRRPGSLIKTKES